jgi:hypothetical protein
MTRFGLRTTGPATPSAPALSFALHLILAALAVPAALTAAYVWFYILKVPLDRPVSPLFANGQTQREGWAAWYVAPPVAFALTHTVFWLYFRKAHRRTLAGFALAGAIAIALGGTAAFWVKNIGYTWYFVPNASIPAIVSALAPMFSFAFGRATHALIEHAPLSFLAGALFGAIVGLLMDLPLRHPRGVAIATSVAGGAPAPVQAGTIGRVVTTAFMTLFVTTVAAAGMPGGAILAAPIIAGTWWLVSFADGRYEFNNVLMGSALLGLISTLPLFLGVLDPTTLVLGVITRTPVYLLVSIVAIRVTLSKTTGAAPARSAVP